MIFFYQVFFWKIDFYLIFIRRDRVASGLGATKLLLLLLPLTVANDLLRHSRQTQHISDMQTLIILTTSNSNHAKNNQFDQDPFQPWSNLCFWKQKSSISYDETDNLCWNVVVVEMTIFTTAVLKINIFSTTHFRHAETDNFDHGTFQPC
jgi:hypothetical protein